MSAHRLIGKRACGDELMKIKTIRGLLGLLAFCALLCSAGCNSMARNGRNSDADRDEVFEFSTLYLKTQ